MIDDNHAGPAVRVSLNLYFRQIDPGQAQKAPARARRSARCLREPPGAVVTTDRADRRAGAQQQPGVAGVAPGRDTGAARAQCRFSHTRATPARAAPSMGAPARRGGPRGRVRGSRAAQLAARGLRHRLRRHQHDLVRIAVEQAAHGANALSERRMPGRAQPRLGDDHNALGCAQFVCRSRTRPRSPCG